MKIEVRAFYCSAMQTNIAPQIQENTAAFETRCWPPISRHVSIVPGQVHLLIATLQLCIQRFTKYGQSIWNGLYTSSSAVKHEWFRSLKRLILLTVALHRPSRWKLQIASNAIWTKRASWITWSLRSATTNQHTAFLEFKTKGKRLGRLTEQLPSLTEVLCV